MAVNTPVEDDISPNSKALHVCEDHFNLEEDMENYMRYKLMGGIKKIQPSVVPHIFDYQPGRKRTFAQPARISALKIGSCFVITSAVENESSTGLEFTLTRANETKKMENARVDENNKDRYIASREQNPSPGP
ncbi:hypothetical protein NQ318_012746 [Aromia moschata]|uniref:Uncharacterized protein n=1 Tax=Aromia moschata TaxID=1265417 RepID=A0AAV8XM86_9CUCU|nr:hypothetical protein NQ318_012746 [Aromia moschata]